MTILKAALLSAFFVPVFHRIATQMADAYSVPGNLSDLVVSHFVRGNLDLNATFLESILFLRQNITSAVTAPENIWGQIFLIGALLYAAWHTIRAGASILKVRSVLANSHFLRGFNGLEIRVSDTVRVPFSTRSLKARIVVIPTSMIACRIDYRVALSHEIQHVRHRDVEWEIAAELLKGLFFWNPAFHYLRAVIFELRELSCDQQVLRRTGLTPQEYCDSLLRVCANRFTRPSVFEVSPPAVQLVETRHLLLRRSPATLLKARIGAALDLAETRQPRWKVGLISTVMVCACIMASFVAAKPKDWTHDRIMLSTIVNLDRLEQRNTFGEREC